MAESGWAHQDSHGHHPRTVQTSHQSGTAHPGTTHIDPSRPHPGTASETDMVGRWKPSWTRQDTGHYTGTESHTDHYPGPTGNTHVDRSRPHPGPAAPGTATAQKTCSDVDSCHGQVAQSDRSVEDFQTLLDAHLSSRQPAETAAAGIANIDDCQQPILTRQDDAAGRLHHGTAQNNCQSGTAVPRTSGDVTERGKSMEDYRKQFDVDRGRTPRTTSDADEHLSQAESGRTWEEFQKQLDAERGRCRPGTAQNNYQFGPAAPGITDDVVDRGRYLEDHQKQSVTHRSRHHPGASTAPPTTAGGLRFRPTTAAGTFLDGLERPGTFSKKPGIFADGRRNFTDGTGVFSDRPETLSDRLERSGTFSEEAGIFSDEPRVFTERPETYSDGPGTFLEKSARPEIFSDEPLRTGGTSSDDEGRRWWAKRCESLDNFQKQSEEDAELGRLCLGTDGSYLEQSPPSGTIGFDLGTAAEISSYVDCRHKQVSTLAECGRSSRKNFAKLFDADLGRSRPGTARRNHDNLGTSAGSVTTGGAFHTGSARPGTGGKFHFDPSPETGRRHSGRAPGTGGFDHGANPGRTGRLDHETAPGTGGFYHNPTRTGELYHEPTPGTDGFHFGIASAAECVGGSFFKDFEKWLDAEPSVSHTRQTDTLVLDTEWRLIDGTEE